MADFHVLTSGAERLDLPEVRRLTIGDLFASLADGWRDFWRSPRTWLFSASSIRWWGPRSPYGARGIIPGPCSSLSSPGSPSSGPSPPFRSTR